MSWLTNFVKPKIQALMRRTEVPDNFWTRCNSCEHMLFQKELAQNLFVCHHCQYHMRIPVKVRLEALFDQGKFHHIDYPAVALDPLKFKDSKKYSDRIKDYRQKTQRSDAVWSVHGKVDDRTIVACALDFDFMGGSMGGAVGAGFMAAANYALQHNTPFLVISASGGARMQEGMISLMQMPRTVAALSRLKEKSLPYLVLLTDPTTGGVSASFAMLGDVHFAEPGCVIGFTGARVIEETIRQKLPEGFQTAEYLYEHGMVDIVTHRHEFRQMLVKTLDIMCSSPYRKDTTIYQVKKAIG